MSEKNPTQRQHAPEGPSRRRTQGERSMAAENALLDATETLIARRGVDQTSLADVGSEAGYSRGLVNHHFGSKAALIDRVAHRIQMDFLWSMREANGVPLENLIDVYLSMLMDNVDTSRSYFVIWGAAIPAESPLRKAIVNNDRLFREGVETLLREGQAEGTVAPHVDPTATAIVIVGMLRGVAAQFLIDPPVVPVDSVIEACRVLIRSILTPPHTA